MKKIFTILAILVCAQALAQMTPEQYKERYERQVRNVGYAGVGVETILDNWEQVAPDDPDMLLGRYYFYFNKAKSTEMVPKAQAKFMGSAPSVTLKAEDGTPVNYFEEDFFDDACFGESQKVLEEVIAKYPNVLLYRLIKVSSLVAYEKEYPDMALMEINNLLSLQSSKHPVWIHEGEKVDEEDFAASIQEFCASFFTIGSESSYEAFRSVSETLNKMYPKNENFLDNLGSYWLVAQKNPKKAISYYDKALKLNPKDATAIKNKQIAQKQQELSKKKK